MLIIFTLFHTNTQPMFEVCKILQFISSGTLVLLYFISVLQVVGLKHVFYVLESYINANLSHYIFSVFLWPWQKAKNTTLQIKILF